MKTVLQVAAAILPLLADPASAASSLVCNTRMGTRSVGSVPTSTTTVTASLRPSITVNVRSTSTRYLGQTYTYTYFGTRTVTTTDPVETDTYTSTSTEIDTDTDTITSYVTSTQTNAVTVQSTSTTTIATTAGFRNIQDTLNSDSLQRRALAHPHAGNSPAKRATKPKQGVLAQAYPSRVDCTSTRPNTNTKTYTSTLRATTVTVPYWAYRTTEYTILTSTSTIVPDHVTSTETETETDTVTVSTTQVLTNTNTVTTTATALQHGPTVWNACNDQNYFGPNFQHNYEGDSYPYYANDFYNNGPNVGANYQIVANGASTMLECCNSCMKLGTCETFMFRPRNRNCFLMYHQGATCGSQFNHPNYFRSVSGSDTGEGYHLGNGLCGYTYSGNSDGSVFKVDDY